MTPKEIQTCIVQAFQRQLRMHSIILPVAALSDAAAHAAQILHGALVECPSCGDAPEDCRCGTCADCDSTDLVDGVRCLPCEEREHVRVGRARDRRMTRGRKGDDESYGDYLREQMRDGAL